MRDDTTCSIAWVDMSCAVDNPAGGSAECLMQIKQKFNVGLNRSLAFSGLLLY